ncbi:unnamed protein product, partial [Mesorhabditis spiculigera]
MASVEEMVKGKDKKILIKQHPSSMPTSPSNILPGGRLEPFDDPPSNFPFITSRTASQEKKRSSASIEDDGFLASLRAAKRPFQSAHQSFRLRMLQEQHAGANFEPVFVTKKRATREGKSNMSEFKGGDLNKYTARSYAIQNGNEVFGVSAR